MPAIKFISRNATTCSAAYRITVFHSFPVTKCASSLFDDEIELSFLIALLRDSILIDVGEKCKSKNVFRLTIQFKT